MDVLHGREQYAVSLEAEVVSALGTAGTRAVHLMHGGHCVLSPAELYPLGFAASAGRSVRQRLSAVVWPPEGGLLGIVCVEVRDAFTRERHVGMLVSRLATEGQAEAGLQAVLTPDSILTIHPEALEGDEPAWTIAVAVDPDTYNAAVLHRGERGTDVFAAPTADCEPLLLPDASLWAPNPEILFSTFTSRA
jgi:hypothetical protein